MNEDVVKTALFNMIDSIGEVVKEVINDKLQRKEKKKDEDSD